MSYRKNRYIDTILSKFINQIKRDVHNYLLSTKNGSEIETVFELFRNFE